MTFVQCRAVFPDVKKFENRLLFGRVKAKIKVLTFFLRHSVVVPTVKVARTEFARRAFAFAAPHLWNSLPFHLRSYDRNCCPASFVLRLKTELFRTYYCR